MIERILKFKVKEFYEWRDGCLYLAIHFLILGKDGGGRHYKLKKNNTPFLYGSICPSLELIDLYRRHCSKQHAMELYLGSVAHRDNPPEPTNTTGHAIRTSRRVMSLSVKLFLVGVGRYIIPLCEEIMDESLQLPTGMRITYVSIGVCPFLKYYNRKPV